MVQGPKPEKPHSPCVILSVWIVWAATLFSGIYPLKIKHMSKTFFKQSALFLYTFKWYSLEDY